MSITLNQIIVKANADMAEFKAKLEVEEKGREIASMQGKIAGNKELLRVLQAEFKLPRSAIADTSDKPLELSELSDEDIIRIQLDAEDLKRSEPWMRVEARIESNVNSLKNTLLYNADSSRDLDLCQGQHKAQTYFRKYFDSIEGEAKFREKKRQDEAKKKASQLPFDEDDESQKVLAFTQVKASR